MTVSEHNLRKAEELAQKVWAIGNRLTEFNGKQVEIKTVIARALQARDDAHKAEIDWLRIEAEHCSQREVAALQKLVGERNKSEKAREATLDEVISIIPGGSVCDPQAICDAIRALKSISAPNIPAAQGWQPISTAPRDGTWIFGYWPTMSITQYPRVMFADDHSEHDVWFMPDNLDFGCVYPSHWMPLPAAPALETTDE